MHRDLNSFWNNKSEKLFCLAPMEDVTDTSFRELVLSVAMPNFLHVLYTEFTSTDGFCHPIGHDKVSHRLFVNQSERVWLKKSGVKLVAQIWGSDPEKFRLVAKQLTEQYDFDGIDINMGCPVKKIVKQASCSALIAFPNLAKEIIQATQEATHLPVSVKTRTGLKQHTTQEWLSHIFDCKPDALILHARTQKMMSDFPAEWNQLILAANVRDSISPQTALIGNGDIFSPEDAQEKIANYPVDGVMIGRGIFKDPWIFSHQKKFPGKEERLDLLLKHARLFSDTWGKSKNFNILKRFFKIYITGFYGAADLRAKLMETQDISQVEDLIHSWRG